jgi:hypothetical protein
MASGTKLLLVDRASFALVATRACARIGQLGGAFLWEPFQQGVEALKLNCSPTAAAVGRSLARDDDDGVRPLSLIFIPHVLRTLSTRHTGRAPVYTLFFSWVV